MNTRCFFALLSLSIALLGGCTSTTTTTTRTETEQTNKRVHTQEELRKTGETDTGPALEKVDPAIRTTPR